MDDRRGGCVLIREINFVRLELAPREIISAICSLRGGVEEKREYM